MTRYSARELDFTLCSLTLRLLGSIGSDTDYKSGDILSVSTEQVEAGQAVYSQGTLRVYDWVVLGISNRFIWQCPTPGLVAHYNKHLSANHLDVGVGTGYFLDRCRFRSPTPGVALMDLNQPLIGATFASSKRTSVCGSSRTCNPRWPAFTNTQSLPRACSSRIVGSRRFWPNGLMPPTLYPEIRSASAAGIICADFPSAAAASFFNATSRSDGTITHTGLRST